MPTGCERTVSIPSVINEQQQLQHNEHQSSEDLNCQYRAEQKVCATSKMDEKETQLVDEMSLSQTSTTSSASNDHNNGNMANGKKVPITSPDPTAYVAKARVTRPTPPPPSYNPMQFVQIKPCNLYQTAQEQLKKAEEVKKIKEIKKEEPEDWQNNLDNWKSSRRKRVEHIIDRVVEVKKLELEDHDRSRKKSKTFNEMMEERGERNTRGRAKLASLAVYNEEESNDLSDLGIGTSSASGKSSLSEDYDNNSVMSDNNEVDKTLMAHNRKPPNGKLREYISSPGYDTSTSTAAASSPDPCEYTYEGAIQDYKQRVSRASSSSGNGVIGYKLTNNNKNSTSKESTPEFGNGTHTNGVGISSDSTAYPVRRGSKIEDRLMGFEVTSPSDSQDVIEKSKVDVPKIDITKRKEIFESQNQKQNNNEPKPLGGVGNGGVPKVTLRDRFKPDASSASQQNDIQSNVKKEVKRLSGDITSIRDRLQSLEQQQNQVNSTNGSNKLSNGRLVDIPVPPLKDRLSSLQNAVTKEEVKKAPVVLVDARQLEIMKTEEEAAKQRLKQNQIQSSTEEMNTTKGLEPSLATTQQPIGEPLKVESINGGKQLDVDRDDSGIHTSDVEHEERNMAEQMQKDQEQQLNAAIAALALEEKQLEEAANAVNQIEAEFAELTSDATALTSTTNDQPREMEFSINEALELALEAIDKETTIINPTTVKTTTTTKLPHDDCMKTMTTTATSKVIKNSKLINKRNKTDEEKELNSRKQYKNTINNNENDGKLLINEFEEQASEIEIFKEPIYENVASEMLSSKDDNGNNVVAAKIIPNSQTNSNNNSNSSLNELTTTNAFANNNATTIVGNSKIITNKTTTATDGIPLIAVKNEITTLEIKLEQQQQQQQTTQNQLDLMEPYYQVPKSSEPYYDAPKHLRPIPVYENIEIFYNGMDNSTLTVASVNGSATHMEPPKEKPPPPPIETPPPMDDDVASIDNTDTWSSDNTYETISSRLPANGLSAIDHPSPPIKRMNSTKRIKKELRNKRSSFLGIEGSLDDDETYLELTVAPPPDMAQLLQEERRLEKQLYMKAGLCDSSDTGESRDSGVSENHSRQSSEHYTNSSEENEHHTESGKLNDMIYQNDATLLTATQTPLLQTVKGNSTESWTESATAAAAATQCLSEATATANAKMLSIEEKIREQEEVLRVERELLQLEQEELKRQRENLMLRENIARRELQHGAKMLMSANRHSLQDLNGIGMSVPNSVIYQPTALTHPMPQHQPMSGQQMRFGPGINPALQPAQQIYANVPNLQQQYYQVDTDYRKSMSDLNEFSKRMMLPPIPPTKPLRSMHIATNGNDDFAARQRHSLNTQHFGGSLVKIAAPAPMPAPRDGHIYSNYHHQSSQNLANPPVMTSANTIHHGSMTRNTLHALSATPKPKYTDGWVQVQNRKSYDNKLANDPAWLSAYQQKRKSMPDGYGHSNNHWLVQEAEQRRIAEQQQQQQQHRRSASSSGTTPTSQTNGAVKSPLHTNGKPLPDAIIQTLTERVQSKGIGERKRFDNYSNSNNNNNIEKSALYATSYHRHTIETNPKLTGKGSVSTSQSPITNTTQGQVQEKVLSVSGKKKCSHCGDELGRGAAMIIESLLLFYHINCFKCCVCHVQLGDGLNGTDVRVRNHKLHCQNCYSSDDGIKFSCV